MKNRFNNWSKAHKVPGWLNFQSLILILVLVIFLSIFLWSDPIANLILPPTATSARMLLTPTILPGTPTPLPPEYIQTDQTNSVVLGGIVLVLIVIGGTLSIIMRKRP